jgi:hypothetical protein
MDDALWDHSLRVNRLQEEHQQPLLDTMTREEQGLFFLTRWGIYDPSANDKPMDALTRAMRYSAILANHLNLLWVIEKCRVSRGFNKPFDSLLILYFRVIVLSGRSTRSRRG